MITRIITNTGEPLVDGTGNPQKQARVRFYLVDESGKVSDAWDALSGERVVPGPVEVLTDNNGVFSVPLWPTSRGDRLLYWLCRVEANNVQDVVAPLVDGEEPLQWSAFKFGGSAPTPQQYKLWVQTTTGVATKALLDAAAAAYDDGECLLVTNDPTPTNNGIWRKEGAGWVQSTDRVAILEASTPRLSTGKNLFNMAALVAGYYVNGTNGVLMTNASYSVSGYIPIFPNTEYYCNKSHYYAFYGANKAFISGANAAAPGSHVSPANAAYLRIAVTTANTAVTQVEVGAVGSTYESYVYRLGADAIHNKAITAEKIAVGAAAAAIRTAELPTETVQAFEPGVNLFNKADLTAGKYVNWNTGALSNNATYSASGFMVAAPQTNYYTNNKYHYGFYDAAQVFISGVDGPDQGGYAQSPAGTAFMRVSVETAKIDTIQLEVGTQATGYQSYGYRLKAKYLPAGVRSNAGVDIVLPPTIYGVVGKELSVYLDNLIRGDAGDYNWDVACAVGQQQNERWTMTPVAAASTTLRVDLYEKGAETTLATATADLTVKAATAGTGVNRKCLFIGDSTTAAGTYTNELLTLFGAGDPMDITLIGTKGAGSNVHEGVSGKTVNYFYTDPASPFVFSGAFNFATYMNTNGYAGLNWVFIHLGINDVFSASSDAAVDTTTATMVAQLEQIITNIKAYDGTIKIGMMVTIPPSAHQDAFGDDYANGQTRWRYKRNITRWARKMIDQFRGRTGNGIYLVPLNVNLDTVRNMNYGAAAPANSRTATTLARQNNGVHPSAEGYNQMADSIYMFLKCQEL